MGKSKGKRQRKRSKRSAAPAPARQPRVSDREREFEEAVAEIRARAALAQSPDAPPERVAAILAEDFESLPSPLGFAQMLAEQGSARARAVAHEVERRAPGSLVALTFAAEVARVVDGDEERSAALLREAAALGNADGAGEVGLHLLEACLLLEALDAAGAALLEGPGDAVAQEVLAEALGRLHARAEAGEQLDSAERDALERFSDRGLLYRLTRSVGEFVHDRPELEELVSAGMREWLEDLEESGLRVTAEVADAFEDAREGFLRLALERAWLRELDDDSEGEEAWPEAEPRLEDSTAPLALLATDPETPPEIADAARRWLETVAYGLWQVADPSPAPGVWLTDIVSGVRRYAAIPPEQLEEVGRWSVLTGALVAIDGTWRSTGALLPMRPSEGDSAAEFVHDAVDDVVRALAGRRARRGPRRRSDHEPHGVLVDAGEPAGPFVADLISKVVSTLLPTIAGGVWADRAEGPALANTDGHRLKLITALARVNDPAAAAERLGAHRDFRAEADGEFTWWGRRMSAMERQTALATLSAEVGDYVPAPDETPRWLRGQLKRFDGGFEVEVNSEERLALLMQVLDELGLEPELTRKSAIDPSEDMGPMRLGGPVSFGGSEAAIDAWLEHWPGERVPALGHLTPRVAARRTDKRPHLEALLREFEHDAHLLGRRGRPAPDIDRLREELGMTRWWDTSERPSAGGGRT